MGKHDTMPQEGIFMERLFHSSRSRYTAPATPSLATPQKVAKSTRLRAESTAGTGGAWPDLGVGESA